MRCRRGTGFERDESLYAKRQLNAPSRADGEREAVERSLLRAHSGRSQQRVCRESLECALLLQRIAGMRCRGGTGFERDEGRYAKRQFIALLREDSEEGPVGRSLACAHSSDSQQRACREWLECALLLQRIVGMRASPAENRRNTYCSCRDALKCAPSSRSGAGSRPWWRLTWRRPGMPKRTLRRSLRPGAGSRPRWRWGRVGTCASIASPLAREAE